MALARLTLLALLLLLSSTPAALVRGEEEARGETVEDQQQQEESVSDPVPEEPAKLDDSLFDIEVFECVAPKGDPAPTRTTPLMAGSILTLCFRPRQMSDKVELKKIASLDFAMLPAGGPVHNAVKFNEALDPMIRAVCPFREDTQLCIVAARLGDMFFSKAAKVAAAGEMLVAATDGSGDERSITFQYDFNTEKKPEQAPIEHEYMNMPATPPSFPCGKEVRIGLIMALLLTLLEFAFSDSDEKESDSSSGKKKKKVTKVA